ncbi:MAG TPA: YciI family protein [Acidimicrobiia bacterium]
MRFLYFYLMKDAPDAVRAAAPDHAAYWHELGLDHYLGGPFADRSGGLITFDVESVGEAERLVAGDPFPQREVIERSWLKEWNVD